MSFDLGVWHSEKPLTGEDAAKIYLNLCQNWPYLEGENSNVVAFYDELTRRWPEIDTVPEGKVDDVAYCPWSCALSHSGMAVVMSCVLSIADEVSGFVQELAKKHELVLFDPQHKRVHLPEGLAHRRRIFRPFW